MKTYKVWIEIEEYDDETDEYDNREGIAVGVYTDLEQAIRMMQKLENIGKIIWPG